MNGRINNQNTPSKGSAHPGEVAQPGVGTGAPLDHGSASTFRVFGTPPAQIRCPNCGGSGWVEGWYGAVAVCASCDGRGVWTRQDGHAPAIGRKHDDPLADERERRAFAGRVAGAEYDPDCPACLRGLTHTSREHRAALARARRP